MTKWSRAIKEARKREERLKAQRAEYVGGYVYDKPDWYLKNDPTFKTKVTPNLKPTKTTILSAKNEFNSGTAIYERKDGIWSVKTCSECLSFLKNKNPSEAKYELLKRGYEYSWT